MTANDLDGWVQWYCFAAAKPYHPYQSASVCHTLKKKKREKSTASSDKRFSKLLTGTHNHTVEAFYSTVISHGVAL